MNTRIQKWCAAGSLVLALVLVLAPHMALVGQTLATTQPVSGTVSITANSAVNVAQVAGATTATGHGTASGALRVELPTDGTGVVGLAAGSAQIGHLEANQSVNAAQINGVTPLMGNGASGTGAQRVTIANDSTGIIALTTGSAQIGHLEANQSVNLAQVGGTTTVNGGVAGSQSVGGTVATNVAITANPLNLGAQAVSSENTAVTTARQVQLVADLVGKLIVLPYSNPENFVSGAITSAMTGTTSTSLIAAPAAGLRNYVTNCVVSNSHATVGTDVILQDGSGGTTLYTLPAAPAYGGSAVSFPTPLRQPTTATALYAADVTTGASVKISCSGYKGA